MSAPPGYNETASMLPDAGGAIRAMHGGFSASPYTGGVAETNSLIPDVRGSITSYSGGAANNTIPVAIASTAVSNSPAPASVAPVAPIAPIAPVEPVAPIAPVEPVAVSESNSAVSESNSAVPAVAATSVSPAVASNSIQPVANSSVAPVSSSSVSVPVQILNANPSSHEALAKVAALAQYEKNTKAQNKANNQANAASNVATTNENVNMNSVEQQNQNEENDDNMKTIIVYGKEYSVPNPLDRKKNDNWDKLMTILGLDVLSEDDQQEFKEMIYEDSSCIEQDLPISTSIKCEPTRKFIFKVATKLLNTSAFNSSGTKVEVIFDPDKQVEQLSVKNIGVLSESEPTPESKDATSDVVKPVEEKPVEGKPVEGKSTSGGLRGKKRRTVRKQK